jgi:hypothetical protein
LESPVQEIRSMTSRHQPAGNPHSSSRHIAYLDDEACFVNLVGDYRYMTSGYYTSQDLEATGAPIHPTCKEILDGYIVPLFLERARLAGLRVPSYYITNDYFDPPVIVDSVNPFMSRQSIVLKAGHKERVAKSLTRNFTYAICCQELPTGASIGHVRAVLGWSVRRRDRALAAAIWEMFHIPIAVVRVMLLPDHAILFSGLQPLPFERLSGREVVYLQKRLIWPT